MSVTIQAALAELGGDLNAGAILTELLTRFMKNSKEDRQAVEMDTLATQTRKSESEVISIIDDLVQQGVLVREGLVKLAPGCLIAITKLSITFDVAQGALDFGATPESGVIARSGRKKKETPESKLLSTPKRLDKLDDEFETETGLWRIAIKPTYAANEGPRAEDVLDCSVFLWLKDEGGEWEAKILDKLIEGAGCVAEAWLFIREFTGWKETLQDWVSDLVRGDSPVDLDDDTFGELVAQSLAKAPEEPERQSLCANALEVGELILGKDGNLFRRVDTGARWPGLPAKVVAEAPKAAKPKRTPRPPKEAQIKRPAKAAK